MDLLGKVLRVPKLEEEQGSVVEVIANARCPRGNHRLTQRQVFENPGRRINLRKRTSMVGNDSHITIFDFADQMPDKVEMHDGTKTYSMSRTGEDWFSGGKKMDAVTVEAFLSAIRSLEATKIASSGFSSPGITIAVTSQDGKHVEKIGIAKSGADYVAKRDDSPTLYQLTSKVVTDLQEAAAVMKPAETAPTQK